MRSLYFLLLLVALASTKIHAETPNFSFYTAKVPEGWTVVEQAPLDCAIGVIRLPISLRHEDGTIWIFGAGLSESDRAKNAAMSEEKWVLEKTGEISGTEFLIFAPKTDRSGSHMVWLPTLETYF